MPTLTNFWFVEELITEDTKYFQFLDGVYSIVTTHTAMMQNHVDLQMMVITQLAQKMAMFDIMILIIA